MNPEFIQRFFNKECTAAEAEKIAAYLKANPDELGQYLNKQEWNHIAATKTLPEEFWNEVWQNIQKRNKAKVISLRLKRIVAAACIILLVSISCIFFINAHKENTKQLANGTVSKLPETKSAIITNNTRKAMHISLQDGSVVELLPASYITYDSPFYKRDIMLEGSAKFNVAKNRKKPFTVYAGALATTALGTIFSVRKTTNKNTVTVKLYEGKVIIHSTDTNLKGWKQDVYLLPGEQMNFNAALNTVDVKNINNIKPAIAAKPTKPNKDSLNARITFNNTALTEVMNKLSSCYKVKIEYDPSVIDTMNFTGTVSKNDSLSFILNAIAQMNNLEITGSNNGFKVSKHPQ